MTRTCMILVFAAALSARAQQWHIREENDAFVTSTDDEYTQGLEIERSWVSGITRWRAGVRNMIYTPSDISLASPPADDRPYGGFTGVALGADARSGAWLVSGDALIGVIGPLSRSEHVQKNFHNAFGFTRPAGWDHQLHDEPAVNGAVSAGYPMRGDWWLLAADATPFVGAAAGTMFTHAEAGLRVRAGINPPQDVLDPGIRIAALGNRPVPVAYAFAAATGRAVAHNTFVSGSLLQDGPGVGAEPFVGILQAGVALGASRTRFGRGVYGAQLTLAWNHRTEEHDGQTSPAQYGTVTLSVGRDF